MTMKLLVLICFLMINVSSPALHYSTNHSIELLLGLFAKDTEDGQILIEEAWQK